MIRLAAQQSWPEVWNLACTATFTASCQIGIGADDERRIATQLQRHFLHILGRRLQDQLTDAGRAGETDRTHAAVLHQGLHGHLRIAQHHVEHAGRKPRLFRQLRQGQSRIRCFMGGLDHHRAPGGQCGSRFAGDHRRREIPRGQQRTDADRLLDRAQMRAGDVAGNVLPVQASRFFGEPRNEAGGVGDFATGFGQGFALLLTENARQVFLVLKYQGCPTPQNGPACIEALFTPGRKGPVRCVNGGDDLRLIEHRYVADQLLVGGVVYGDAVAAVTVDPMAVDVAEGFEQQWMFIGHGVHSDPCA